MLLSTLWLISIYGLGWVTSGTPYGSTEQK